MNNKVAAEEMEVVPNGALRGTITPPPDKSIAHRALLLAALNRGTTTVLNPSTADDPQRSRALIEAIGCRISMGESGYTIQRLEEIGGTREKPMWIDCGNSGSTARMACGLLAGEEGSFILTGDDSLSRRPMMRVVEPLQAMGARLYQVGGCLPITIDGHRPLSFPHKPLSIASAQVYTAVAFAAMRADGRVRIRRTAPMRDHTAQMLRAAGVELSVGSAEGEDVDIIVPGEINRDITIAVPGDPSAGAILAAAASIVPESSVEIAGVSLNHTRLGFFRALERMGGAVSTETTSNKGGEPVGTIRVEAAALRGIAVDGANDPDVTLMVDELPLLALLGAVAEGETSVRGARELRVKESDRIAITCALMREFGLEIEELEDGFSVRGPQKLRGGGSIDHAGDHRLCMLAALAGLIADAPTRIPDPAAVAVSYPGFWADLQSLGAVVSA